MYKILKSDKKEKIEILIKMFILISKYNRYFNILSLYKTHENYNFYEVASMDL